MADDVVIVWNPAGLLEVAHSEQVRAEVRAIGARIAAAARGTAPRSDHHRGPSIGHGADSIRVEMSFDAGDWEAKVGWDALHAYMRYPEKGTRHQPGQHFLLHAADRYARP